MHGFISLDKQNVSVAPSRTQNPGDFFKIDEHEGTPINASVSSYFTAGLYRPLVRQLAILDATCALDELEYHDQDGTRVLQSNKTHDYDALWIVSDEKGITFMFPEEY